MENRHVRRIRTPKLSIIRELRTEIASGKLRPGLRLTETALSSRFGVSRTPVREALKQLEREGLVRISPNQGAWITELSTKDVEDIYDVLISLEATAARLACPKLGDKEMQDLEEYQFQIERAVSSNNQELLVELNTAFHRLIIENTTNPYFVEIRNNFSNLIHRYWQFIAFVPEFAKANIDDHPRIIRAFTLKNPPLAEFLMREHLEKAKSNMLRYIGELQQKGRDESGVQGIRLTPERLPEGK
jgi:DNA-binding GntR family transcriptional regulator